MQRILFDMAIADAYAMGWEFLKPETEAPIHDWSGYRANPQIPAYTASKYSDDTMRALINARVMLESDPMDPLEYIRILKQEFRADPRDGWSRKFREYLTMQLERPDAEWLEALMPRNTNGGIMGSTVCGFLGEVNSVIGAARAQALITHDEEAAVFASGCALALYGLRKGEADLQNLHRYACGHEPRLSALMPDLPDAPPPRSMLARDTYATALRILGECADFRGILDRTIEHGGDTDSIASVAVSIAGVAEAYDGNYPEWAVERLDLGNQAIHARLLSIGARLTNIDPVIAAEADRIPDRPI